MIRELAIAALVIVAMSGTAAAQDQGPSGDFLPDLPDQVSDVADAVLDTIGDFLDDPVGSMNDLGAALGDLLSGGKL